MYKNLYIANDHTAVEYKQKIIEHFKDRFNIIDLGTDTNESCNYASYAQKLGFALTNDEQESFGILICGTGIGISIAANKVQGIRCALIYNDEVAALAKKHNNANVIAFGARQMQLEDIIRRIEIFIISEFEGGRHQVRIESLE